jgi:PD-(D/E)XK nuclease superfamily
MPDHGALIDGVVRQSTLRMFSLCPLATSWAMEQDGDWTSEEAALGTVAHGVLECILKDLKMSGEQCIGFDRALELMGQAATDPEMPVLGSEALADLKILTLQLAKMEWSASHIVALEDRLWADVSCPDGKNRRVTGKPDFVMRGSQHGEAICGDLKTGWAAPPPAPRDDNWTKDQGKPYLSERGLFQLDLNALLVMRRWKGIRTVVLREWHLRHATTREAWLTRDELPEVERRVGILLQQFEQMQTGERKPEARAGTHCKSMCPNAAACPIPPAERRSSRVGNGELLTLEQELEAAEVYAAVCAQKDRLSDALKSACEGGHAIPVQGGYVGWKATNGTGRRFGVHAGTPEQEDA